MSLPRKPVDWKRYDEHKAANGSDAAFAKSLGIDPRNFPQYKKTRHLDEPPVNGNLPAIRPAHSDAPERISALPVHYDASEVDDIKSRLATLEAFMSALQEQQRISALPAHQNASAHPIASQRTEPPTWVSRGMHVAVDMLERIDTYAAAHRLEKREVLDRILHTFFAEMERTVPDA
jgi:hypothetical protein